jgi:hypothetical protein
LSEVNVCLFGIFHAIVTVNLYRNDFSLMNYIRYLLLESAMLPGKLLVCLQFYFIYLFISIQSVILAKNGTGSITVQHHVALSCVVRLMESDSSLCFPFLMWCVYTPNWLKTKHKPSDLMCSSQRE